MAKTRIKTTPTRMQKEALMASAAVTTTTNVVTEHVFKKRLSVLKNSITSKQSSIPVQSTIIVQSPKRTNSISSATSTISHTSDVRSCNDSPPPPPPTLPMSSLSNCSGPTMAELTENAIKTLNAGLLAKSNALALKNRKVYMITERCDDNANGTNANGGGAGNGGGGGVGTGQKRKMYLIMEEKESDNKANGGGGDYAEKLMKTDNSNASKKLTLFTDTTNGQLPQKFEKILPEILNCIHAKNGAVGGVGVVSGGVVNEKIETSANTATTTIKEVNNRSLLLTNNNINPKFPLKSQDNERLPLTLPPKKNRTKIITTQIIPVNASTQALYDANGHDAGRVGVYGYNTNTISTSTTAKTNGCGKSETKSSATPVIVNASTLMTSNGGGGNGYISKENGSNSATQLHKNINLSTDFLFLMKMLPKLESIEEPHKNYVKNCIEDIINQYAPVASQSVDQ